MSQALQALTWRYATQKFDPAKKLTAEQLSTLLESARLAPSSFGLQPWKFVVVQNPELRQKISAAAWNQAQVTEASDLIVLCAKTTLDETYVDRYMKLIADTRGISAENLGGLKAMIMGSVARRSPSEVTDWNKRQTYIALGTLLTAAALHGIDASPMEGFDPQQVDDILGLAQEGFTSAALCAVGFRNAHDPAAEHKKARFPLNEIVSYR
jgi:nitroreductase